MISGHRPLEELLSFARALTRMLQSSNYVLSVLMEALPADRGRDKSRYACTYKVGIISQSSCCEMLQAEQIIYSRLNSMMLPNKIDDFSHHIVKTLLLHAFYFNYTKSWNLQTRS